MRNQLFKTCILLPAIFLANGAVASEKSHSTASNKAHSTGNETASKAKSRVLGGHSTVATKSDHAPKASSGKGGHGSAHWTYGGATGPGHWGAMKPAYAACKDGLMQSPIDIRGGLSAKPQAIRIDYKMSPLTILNNGHTVQVNYGKGSRIEIGGKSFDLLQFHFHTPSEHMVTGQRYPMEMHLVHQSSDGTLAVIGVMIKPGKENLALSEIWPHLPSKAGAPKHAKSTAINARDLLPAAASYHHYKGSLTTPPCSEGVNWFVMSNPIEASTAQIGQLSKIMGDNARPAQPINQRLVISGK